MIRGSPAQLLNFRLLKFPAQRGLADLSAVSVADFAVEKKQGMGRIEGKLGQPVYGQTPNENKVGRTAGNI
jgi:hypothetical protein